MNTRLEIPEARSAIGWRPFGDAIPLPRSRRDAGRSRPTGEVSRSPARRDAPTSVPLWLPFALALALGALVALVAALLSFTRSEEYERPIPVPVSVVADVAGEIEPLAPQAGYGERYAAAVPDPARPRWRRPPPHASAVFAPERVSDLKANPFVARRPVGRAPTLVFEPQRVSDLKANPYH